MFIRFFKSSYLIQYLVLVIIGVVLWIPAFLHPPQLLKVGHEVAPLFKLIEGLEPGVPWIPVLIAFLLVLAEGIIMNIIFIYHDLVPKNTLLSSFLFLLFMSSSAPNLTFYPAILSVLPLVFFLQLVFQIYDQSENLSKVLSVGLLASVCSMIYTPLILLLLFLWLVFMVYRTFNLREWIIAFMGFILPYIYLIVFYFWNDKLGNVLTNYRDYTRGIFDFTFSDDILQISIWVIFSLLMLLPSIVRVISGLSSNNIAFRRKMAVTIWLAVFGAFITLTGGNAGFNTVIYLPAAAIVAYQFQVMKKSAWNEIVLLAYIILVGIHNYMAW